MIESLQHFQRNEVQRTVVGAFQNHWRRDALRRRFYPTQCAQTPLIACLQAGANDAGGTLIDESITKAAGGLNGQAQTPADFARAAASIGRRAAERTMKYEMREAVGAD